MKYKTESKDTTKRGHATSLTRGAFGTNAQISVSRRTTLKRLKKAFMLFK